MLADNANADASYPCANYDATQFECKDGCWFIYQKYVLVLK